MPLKSSVVPEAQERTSRDSMEGFLETASSDVPFHRRHLMEKRGFWSARPNLVQVILSHFFTLIFLYIPLFFLINRMGPSFNECDVKYGSWEPAQQSIEYKAPEHYKGEISQTNAFRGPPLERPSEDVDKAWHRFGNGAPGVRLTEEDLKALDKRDDPGRKLHRLPEASGGGYLGMLEVFHLVHCLDNLRKATFYNWQYYESELQGVDNVSIATHHNHCIDAIRMSLMCSADTTPITFYDDEKNPERQLPMPDFSSKHICRDIDRILKWSWDTDRKVLWENVGNSSTWKGEQANVPP